MIGSRLLAMLCLYLYLGGFGCYMGYVIDKDAA